MGLLTSKATDVSGPGLLASPACAEADPTPDIARAADLRRCAHTAARVMAAATMTAQMTPAITAAEEDVDDEGLAEAADGDVCTVGAEPLPRMPTDDSGSPADEAAPRKNARKAGVNGAPASLEEVFDSPLPTTSARAVTTALTLGSADSDAAHSFTETATCKLVD